MPVAKKTRSTAAIPTLAERMAAGKGLRSRMTRSAHASPPGSRRDPIELLQASNAGRIADLVPIRYGRMLKSPYAFLRGSSAVMAWDLGHRAHSQLVTQLCDPKTRSEARRFREPWVR